MFALTTLAACSGSDASAPEEDAETDALATGDVGATDTAAPPEIDASGTADATTDTRPATDVGAETATDTPEKPLRFAVVGDYGDGSTHEAAVAKLVAGWSPEFVLALGDNNYPAGAASTIDGHIGKYYAPFIGGYTGAFGPGSTKNRFWPIPGNHDWMAAGLKPYLDYFKLPNNERYYEQDLGLVRVFAIDSDSSEPDGITATSTQGKWFQARMTASKSCWNLAMTHHPAYNSGSSHGSTLSMRWPFKAWGIDAVFQGHEHVYERLLVDGQLYVTSGNGGAGLYSFGTPLPGSQARFASDWGAVKVEVTRSTMTLESWSVGGKMVDTYTMKKPTPCP